MNHFNLVSQRGQGWLNRAAIAANMIRKHVSEGSVIADLGCGDMMAERENNPMSRKRLAYRRESTRKGK